MFSHTNTNSNTRTRTARRLVAAGLVGLISLAAAGGAHADGRRTPPPAPPITPFELTAAPSDDDADHDAADDRAPAPPPPSRPGTLDEFAALQPSGYSLTNVKITPRGTWARMRYTTNSPTVTVRVSEFQPKLINGVWAEPYMDSIVGPDTVDTTKGGVEMKWDKLFLLPDTTYYYIITVPTAADEVPVQAVGSFTTLRRTLTITFDTIAVTDDSDPGLKGAGDFSFWFEVNGEQIAQFSKSIASDSSYDIVVDGKPLQITIPDVLHTDVPFGVQVYENDVQKWDECGKELLGGDSWDGVGINKENSCGTWLHMFDEYYAGPGDWEVGYGQEDHLPIPFTLTRNDSSVHMTITGTIVAVWS
jgi:hypothetical protein